MNTSDFENNKTGKTRLGAPIRRGERVVVPILREDFQERFLASYDQADACQQLKDEWRDLSARKGADDTAEVEAARKELRIKRERADQVFHIHTEQLWVDVKDHYKLWGTSVGVRDGFVLVALREEDNPMNQLRTKMGIGFSGPGGKVSDLMSEADIPDEAPEEVKKVMRKLLELMRDLDSLQGE